MKPFTAEELRERYGRFYERRRKFDASLLPTELQPLAPYAEVWGEGDDYKREELVDSAPEIAKEDLLALFKDKLLYRSTVDWLAETADRLAQSDGYQALSCLYLSALSLRSLRE